MKTIAIDMDNVIVDIESQYIKWYAQKFGLTVSKEALYGMPETEGFPDKAAVRAFLDTPDFFRSARPLPNALPAVRELMKTYNVFIASAAMEFPVSLSEKLSWLNEHLPEISWRNIIFCGDKSIIRANYMIDDYEKNLDTFNGRGLLFTASHNALVNRPDRVNNWSEVLQWFQNEQAQES